jgi:hypothetical protein
MWRFTAFSMIHGGSGVSMNEYHQLHTVWIFRGEARAQVGLGGFVKAPSVCRQPAERGREESQTLARAGGGLDLLSALEKTAKLTMAILRSSIAAKTVRIRSSWML